MSHEPLPHEAFRDDLAAYSIGALAPEEAAALETHLAGCEACTEYLRWIDPAVNTLPTSVEQLEPPKSLKRDLMATVREEAKQAHPKQRRSWFGDFGWRPAAALAACLLVAAGIVGGYALRGDSAGDTETIAFTTQTGDPTPGSTAKLEVDGGQGKVVVAGMQPLPDDRVYQLWRQVDGELVPSTVFVVHRDGTGEVAVEGSLDDADALFVTVEPIGGSEVPTSTPLMRATLS